MNQRPQKQNLYFIAVILSGEIAATITKFKEDFANRFLSKEALKVIPHITLKTPFKLFIDEHQQLLSWFKKLFLVLDPFSIELNNFGAFHNMNSPVVFVHPVMNTNLYALQKEIIRSFKISFPGIKVGAMDLKFKPHMTIAYRDLSPELFQIAWDEYKVKEYKAVFDVKSFYLLQHDTKKWNIIDTYSLQKK